MEWIVGESPNDLLYVSSENSIENGSTYSERQQYDARKRLIDLVCKNNCITLLKSSRVSVDSINRSSKTSD